MFTRRLLSAVCVAGLAAVVPAQAAFAADHSAAELPSQSQAALFAKALKVTESAPDRVSALGYTGGGVDAIDDAPFAANITNTKIDFDAKNIAVTTTLARAIDPATDAGFRSGDYALAVQMAFNRRSTIDALLILSLDDRGNVSAIGQNQYGGFCDANYSVAGNDITITTDSDCFYRPGSIAYNVTYGNFTRAYNQDFSEIDLAPDMGLTNPVGRGGGYWLLGHDGGIFSFGDAQFYGSTGNIKLNKPVVGMSAMPDNAGYRFVASDGGVFNYGSAQFYGSTGNLRLNQPVVGMSTTPSGKGYWLVASDGGIFAFGDAQFYGSTGALKLNKPIVGMTTTKSGNGYWLVASDGGIFAFGDAAFLGSTGNIKLNLDITSMAISPSGKGYYLLAEDGGVFSFGEARFYGSGANEILGTATSITATDAGYRITDATGGVWEYGESYHYGDLIDLDIWPNSPIIGLAELR